MFKVSIYIAPFQTCVLPKHFTCNLKLPSSGTINSVIPFVRGSHSLPSQLPWEHKGHKAATRHSESIWNSHYSSTYPHCWYSINLPLKGWRAESTLWHRHQFSQRVTHPSTNWTRGCLTSVIDWELVKSCHFATYTHHVWHYSFSILVVVWGHLGFQTASARNLEVLSISLAFGWFCQWPTPLMLPGCIVVVVLGVCVNVGICVQHPTPGHMVDASEFIYGIFISILPPLMHIKLGIWHFRGIFFAGRYFAILC